MRNRYEDDTSRRGVLIADAILAVLSGSFLLIYKTTIHPAICISICLVAAGLLIGLFFNSYGYWAVTLIFSWVWAAIAGAIAFLASSEDTTWGIVIGCYAFLLGLYMHGIIGRIKYWIGGRAG